jgi:hypothetical protein
MVWGKLYPGRMIGQPAQPRAWRPKIPGVIVSDARREPRLPAPNCRVYASTTEGRYADIKARLFKH